MQTIDIPLPESEFEYVKKLRTFNFIYPSDHRIAQYATASSMIRLISFEDYDYMALSSGESTINEVTPTGGNLFEIGYIREVALGEVTNKEWIGSYGPKCAEDFISFLKNTNIDTYVKVINVRVPNYSLGRLNRTYIKNGR